MSTTRERGGARFDNGNGATQILGFVPRQEFVALALFAPKEEQINLLWRQAPKFMVKGTTTSPTKADHEQCSFSTTDAGWTFRQKMSGQRFHPKLARDAC